MNLYVEGDFGDIIDISAKTYSDRDLCLYDTIFEMHIGSKLVQLIEINNKYHSIGSKKVTNDEIPEYFEKLFIACSPTILKGRLELQQVYLLHLTAILLTRFNDKVLLLQSQEFNETIYFPNLLNICAKHLINARRFVHRIIKNAFSDFKVKNNDIIIYYSELYNIDEQYLLNDVNYFFLSNVLPKFDPIKLVDINSIYFNTIQRMFYFYIKSKISQTDHDKLDSVQMYNYEHLNTSSERYCLYEEALYLAQLYRVCETTNVSNQIKEQIQLFKKSIITNEFQKLLIFNIQQDRFNNRLINSNLIHDFFNDTYDLSKFKIQTPIVYRLLRSIHIKNANNTFSDSDISYIKPHIQITLSNIYSEFLGDEGIKTIIPKLTENLINTLLIGEYIDMMTMTVVTIPIVKFTDQLKLFLSIILNMGSINE